MLGVDPGNGHGVDMVKDEQPEAQYECVRLQSYSNLQSYLIFKKKMPSRY